MSAQDGAGGRGDKGGKDVCLRLCLIISVVTLKMHKCCLNAIQEMQRAKIEMYSALQQQQLQLQLQPFHNQSGRAHISYPACAWRYDRRAPGQAMSLPCLKGGHDRQR